MRAEAVSRSSPALGRNGGLADQVVVPGCRAPAPTPLETLAVRDFAWGYPQMGYKRLAWQMVDFDVAYLRPYQVYDLLRADDFFLAGPCHVQSP